MEIKAVYNVDRFLSFIHEFVEQFRAGEAIGDYSYKKGKKEPDLYGSSDILMTLHTINALNLNEKQKQEWIEILQGFQNPKTGWFKEKETFHFKEHSTAYCTAALDLIGGKPKYPLKFLEKVNTKEKVEKWLKRMLWSLAWPTSHRGSGVAATLSMTGEGPEEWFDWFFEWLEKKVNPKIRIISLIL